ncbi:unnamed protein product [Pieris macdunnoughi]|uniref:C2H2-type domain-containing protein n=1 Tax=Pieris macdunnoughi TaxID=345717 RepID=A0A821Y2C2_9NEOP|nr:unnamed protein product [Pieris macdunnoughi]
MKLKKLKSDSEEPVPLPAPEIIEADLYKRSYFGPDVPTLELECWEEELSEAQLQAYRHADEEYKKIQNTLDDIVKDTGGKIVYNGDQFTAYQLLGKQPVLKDLERQSAEIIRSRSRSISISKESKSGKRTRGKRDHSRDKTASPEPRPSKKKKKDKEKKKDEKESKEITKTKDKTLAPSNVHSVVTNVRPSEATAVGGLLTGSAAKTTAIVDLTKDDGNKNVADSREVSFNKLQGKTFPSLVVVARPYLRSKDAPASDRASLDTKVKSVLVHTPMKFTEWLIQQGLVRSEQWCAIHRGNKLKLGMYSDSTKFPYSGGYVWISECCPTRFVSVFSSSLFEGATFPPSVLLKLIYHWACQTNVQNVVQWVKVDNLYVKGLFTWLRGVCTAATHRHLPPLGAAGRPVEVGVISLGTTSHDGTQRQVKVEVLGVLDPADKLIRLRAVEPLAEHEKNYKKRFQKILEPLAEWVHPGAAILTDLTVDKSTLHGMGFKNVHQSSSHGDAGKHSNANIMEYLRRIVPRMFQNTLSLLSRQIIQQFLDELVWRERFGSTPGQAFDNIVTHLAEQTKLDSKDSITVRLNKIAANPFKNWKYPAKKKDREAEEVAEPETGRGRRGRRKREPSPPPVAPPRKRKKEKTLYVDDDDDEEVPLAQRRNKIKQEKNKEADGGGPGRGRRKRAKSYLDVDEDDNELDIPLKNIKKELKADETVSLERYYFGQTQAAAADRVAIAVQCPECDERFSESGELQRHLFDHAVDGEGATCAYCLTRMPADELAEHLRRRHPVDTKSPELFTYACLICEVRFAAVLTLAAHMQKTHAPRELPYACPACPYRASAHRAVLDHARAAHGRSAALLCPLCLEAVPVYADGCELRANVVLFLAHLRRHRETLEVRCNRCVLRFVHLGRLKEHQIRDHKSREDALPLCTEEHLINRPKTKARPPVKDSTSHSIGDTFERLTLVLPTGRLCRECDAPLEAERHFLGVTSCSKCPYATSCYRAMLRHSGFCAGPHSLEDAPRAAPRPLHCVCGYSSSVGTDALTHLLVTRHTTVYASEEDARANVASDDRDDRKDSPVSVPETRRERIGRGSLLTESLCEQAEAREDGEAKEDGAAECRLSPMAEFAPAPVINTQLSLDDLAPPSLLQQDQERELPRYEGPLATPRHEEQHYTLGDFEPLPQEPPPQTDFEQL